MERRNDRDLYFGILRGLARVHNVILAGHYEEELAYILEGKCVNERLARTRESFKRLRIPPEDDL